MADTKPAIVDTRVRVPADLYEQIKQLAEDETRSINGQMVALLREAVERRPPRKAKKDQAQL